MGNYSYLEVINHVYSSYEMVLNAIVFLNETELFSS